MEYHGRLAWVEGECQRCGGEWGIWVPLEPGHDLWKGGICCGYCNRPITKTAFREAMSQVSNFELEAVRKFVERVNERAEQNMEKTGKLEGSHYAAMQVEMDLLEKDA